MATMLRALQFCVLILSSGLCSAQTGINPCLPEAYTTLSDTSRNTGYDTRSTDTPICDDTLQQGWYRFTGVNGESVKLPTSCVENNRCGTTIPIWMNGSHPKVGEGTVSRQVCGRYDRGNPNAACCQNEMEIFVRNCKDFYVYFLSPTPMCNTAYCAGTDVRCPDGKWSVTNFEPCRDLAPKILQPPELQGPIVVDNEQFYFQCKYLAGFLRKGLILELWWTFNGEPDPSVPHIVHSGFNRSIVLYGDQLSPFVNTEVGCRAIVYYESRPNDRKTYDSNQIFFGIQGLPSQIEMDAGDGDKVITLYSTVPVVCKKGKNCCIGFDVTVNKKSVVYVKDSCKYNLCSSHWDLNKRQSVLNITLTPYITPISTGRRKADLTIEIYNVSLTGQYVAWLLNMSSHQMKVTLNLQPGFICSITGDASIQGHDYRGVYRLQQTGDYILYESRENDFTVHIRTKPSLLGQSVCAVSIREHNEVIRVGSCDLADLRKSNVDTANELSSGTAVQRSTDGQVIGIIFQSGTEVRIDISIESMDVFIQSSASDTRKASGLSGTNDGIQGNDFTLRNKTVISGCNGSNICYPNIFTASWRVTDKESLFVVAPGQVPAKPVNQYCSCVENIKGTLESCSPRRHIQETDVSCYNCIDITKVLKPFPWGTPGFTEKPYIHKNALTMDVNQEWPNKDNVTKKEAEALCSEALQKSPLYITCQNVVRIVEYTMNDCLSGILLGKTKEDLHAFTSSFTVKCQFYVAGDEANYLKGQEDRLILNPQFNALICFPACSEHGYCAPYGSCICDSGWEGDTCQIESEKGPQITRKNDETPCDYRQQSCNSVQFDKSNVNIHAPLICRVQTVDEQGNTIGSPATFTAVTDPNILVACPLPQTNMSSQRYMVSVSVDGKLYGNELPVVVYDSLCMACDETGCQAKNSACNINNVCYNNRAKKPDDQKLFCNIRKSTIEWSDSRF